MSDLEHFGGASEGSEGMSEAAMEAFREQMRAAAQQVKQLQKGEQKRKKKEEKLAALLTQFLQRKSGRSDLAFLAAHVLALNIPPAFVLSVLLLGDRESQQELTMAAKEDDKGLEVEVVSGEVIKNITLDEDELALLRTEDEAQSQLIIDEVLVWIEILYIQARNDQIRIIRNGYDEEHRIQPSISEYMSAVMKHFMTDNGMNIPPENIETLTRNILHKLFSALEENLSKVQLLRDQEFESLPPPSSEDNTPGYLPS